MRKLKASDIPAFCRCLKAIGVKDQIAQIARDAETSAEVWDKGFDLIWNILDSATEADKEKHLYEFLARPFESTPDAVADMDLADFIESIKRLAAENDLAVFFKSAEKLMK